MTQKATKPAGSTVVQIRTLEAAERFRFASDDSFVWRVIEAPVEWMDMVKAAPWDAAGPEILIPPGSYVYPTISR